MFFKKLHKKCMGQLSSEYVANSLRPQTTEMPYKNSERSSFEDSTVMMCSGMQCLTVSGAVLSAIHLVKHLFNPHHRSEVAAVDEETEAGRI